ncbi:MAG TPA: glycoside hydrolase family 2 TIM barrel-domain containing protein [Polyangia bacterium]|nr:glycoside hydrolase family 2 TIM barrel-domain containing protein [Polyangia bacterium]
MHQFSNTPPSLGVGRTSVRTRGEPSGRHRRAVRRRPPLGIRRFEMKRPLKLPLALVISVSVAACASGGGTATGNGGSGPASGGSVGAGGAVGSGASAGKPGNGGTGAGQVGTGGLPGSAAGGTAGLGGATGAGGNPPGSGGSPGAGGLSGGAGGGGASGLAGAGGTVGQSNRVRTIISSDAGWLFHYGDATGASAATFADATWRTVNVPHDWSIEGPSPPTSPFSQSAATTGRGAYVPSGIAWYRKHFTLPQALSGQQVYVEFDAVMENSDVYVNGVHLGHHPYGYVSFRYDMTGDVQFGTADNVIAVKTDTTTQPAERFFAGAGIYRHVRLIVANPVHIGQYATFVTTPSPTTAAATVHVTTTIENHGASSQNVSLKGTVSDPTGTALAPVTAPPQTIAAGGAVTFTFEVPVSNPKLWDLAAPNMYQLRAEVQIGGVTVDDDVVAFGIRELTFATGMTLNGKSVKFQGVANHQDFHGLGVAAPQRAMQRRLAQLKALGVNAIRTAHEPPSPDLLDLTDRMGFLVLDEFTDVWTAHKYTDVGDYAAYFNQTATTPTGMPAVPAVSGVTNAGATWWQVDFTGWIMRDRNHPSVALYSMGNEIHDSINTRTPILTKMIAMSHALDPSRNDTQALLDPATSGDVGGPTNKLLDVWGDNYDVASCLTAMTSVQTKSGLMTEEGTETSTWTTVKANPGLTGEFIWTGVDYLGEADGEWPTVGSNSGLMDELGNIRSIGQSWQTTWGVPKTNAPPAGTTASKVVVTADHPALVTDLNDIVFVEAAVSDSSGGIVTSSAVPITFALTGPGTIVAVDSGSMTQETFRGNVRKAYQGIAYALVQASQAGTIVVTASAAGLTAGMATIQATAGTFVPCSGTCD